MVKNLKWKIIAAYLNDFSEKIGVSFMDIFFSC